MRIRRIVIIAMCCCMSFSLIGCGRKLKSPDELIAKARKEITVTVADTIEVQLAAKLIKKDRALMWFITGNEYQMHSYFSMVFEVVGEEEYVFVQRHNALERGQDIFVYNWGDGYSFMVNNPKCKTIQIIGNLGGLGAVTEVEIGEGEYPFHYYYELMPQEYKFLDVEGKEIRQ